MQQRQQHQTNNNGRIQPKATYPTSSRAVTPIYYRKMQHFNDTTYNTGDNANAAPYYRHTSPYEDQYYGMTAEQWLLSPRAAMTASVDGQIQEPHFNDVYVLCNCSSSSTTFQQSFFIMYILTYTILFSNIQPLRKRRHHQLSSRKQSLPWLDCPTSVIVQPGRVQS